MKLMKRLGLFPFIAILALIFVSLSPGEAHAVTVGDLSGQFICQCGCTSVLNNCTHVECGSRETMTALIQQKIEEGQSGEQIVQLFVAQYGEQVLSAPPKQGFNLMAWITPFAALLFGAWLVYLMLRKWVGRGAHVPPPAPVGTDESDEKYRHQLEKELEEFPERSFR